MTTFSSLSDDYYVNVTLNTEMDLPGNRETVLHFFEQIQRQYPTMTNFYSRGTNEFVLEEDKESGIYRWTSVEPRRVISGQVNPESLEQALTQHRTVLEMAPFYLSASSLDCESLNIMIGFDFTYQGNHNQLVSEALGISGAFESITRVPGARIVDFEPAIQLALDEGCRLQARLGIETRTTPFQIRTGEYAKDQLSVYLLIRRYGSLDTTETFPDVLDSMVVHCEELMEQYVVDQILVPLQQAITIG